MGNIILEDKINVRAGDINLGVAVEARDIEAWR